MSKRTRVLVVDDEERFGRMVKVNLEMTGRYEVKIETQGKCCVATARVFTPDLILLDIVMPDMAGSEVVQALHKDPELKLKPLIFLTALSQEEASFHLEKTPDAFVLTKPIASQDLAAWIDRKTKGD